MAFMYAGEEICPSHGKESEFANDSLFELSIASRHTNKLLP